VLKPALHYELRLRGAPLDGLVPELSTRLQALISLEHDAHEGGDGEHNDGKRRRLVLATAISLPCALSLVPTTDTLALATRGLMPIIIVVKLTRNSLGIQAEIVRTCICTLFFLWDCAGKERTFYSRILVEKGAFSLSRRPT